MILFLLFLLALPFLVVGVMTFAAGFGLVIALYALWVLIAGVFKHSHVKRAGEE